jgi:DDE family transposase
VKGRERHIITDTLGLLVGLVVHAADLQDRDGAPKLLRSIRQASPWLRHIFADGLCCTDRPVGRLVLRGGVA